MHHTVGVAEGGAAPHGPDELNRIFDANTPGGRGECRPGKPHFSLQQVDAAAAGVVDPGDSDADFSARPYQLGRIAQDSHQLPAVQLHLRQITARLLTRGGDRVPVLDKHCLQPDNQLQRFLLHGPCLLSTRAS
ncbi:MAG: hypothetical protein KGI68_04580 [Alphaproteobacteria bacterium]|nr:hypothetical protein [Alphaproteobacteria bacterium]MDE2162660.1 hypothetical protein [Alphaproteobacteria bacterium]